MWKINLKKFRNQPFVPAMTFLIAAYTLLAFYAGWSTRVFQWESTLDNPGNFIDMFRYMFAHGSSQHLFGNMLFFLILAPVCEKRLGAIRFLYFYFGTGALSALGFGMFHPDHTLIGASGGVAGLMAAYPFLQRTITGRFLGGVVMTFYFVNQFQLTLASWIIDIDHIAFMGHVAGGVAGLVLLLVFRKTWAKNVEMVTENVHA